MIKIVKGDITKISDVDAIVNAANKTLLGGGGVDGAIHHAAGAGLFWECIKLGGCRTGDAKITRAYNLPFKYIIHTVGPVWKGGNKGEPEQLESCYCKSLTLAHQYGVRKIAFPSISTGAYKYPIEQASKIAVSAVKKYLSQNQNDFDLVEWVLFDDETFAVYEYWNNM